MAASPGRYHHVFAGDASAWFAGHRFSFDRTDGNLLRGLAGLGAKLGAVVAVEHPDERVLEIVRSEGKVELLHRPDLDFAEVRRGYPDYRREDILSLLSPDAGHLIETGAVLVVDRWSDEIPLETAKQIDARASGRFGFGMRFLACCVLRDDGRILIVLEGAHIDAPTLRHEMIHAAQCLADGDAMAAAMEAVIEDGRRITQAAKGDARPPRDIEWGSTAWPGSTDVLGTFEMAMLVGPSEETAAAGAELGIAERMAVVAAVSAWGIRESGHGMHPTSDIARELVAYRYMAHEADVVDDLFASAAVAVEAEPAAPTRQMPSP